MFCFRAEDPEAMHPIRELFIRKRGAQDAVDVWKLRLAEIISEAISNFSEFDGLDKPEPISLISSIVYRLVVMCPSRINDHTTFEEEEDFGCGLEQFIGTDAVDVASQ